MNEKSTIDAKVLAERLWKEGYFRRSKRQYRLFEYLLKNSLSETPVELDQYKIATDVLGRTKDFDPYNDSIVRSEISRLRKALDVYNAKKIDYSFEIPQGRYNIEVTSVKSAPPSKAPTSQSRANILTWPRIVTLALLLLFASWAITQLKPTSITAPIKELRAECSQAQPNLELVFETESLGENSYVESLVRASTAQYSNIKRVLDAKACRNDFAPAYSLSVKQKIFGEDEVVLFQLETLDQTKSIYLERERVPKNKFTDDNFDIPVHSHISKLLRPYGIIPRHAITLEWPDKMYQSKYKCNIGFYDDITSNKDDNGFVECLETAYNNKKATLDNIGVLTRYYIHKINNSLDNNSYPLISKTKLFLEEIGDDWIENTEMVGAKIAFEKLDSNYTKDSLRGILYAAHNRYPDNVHVSFAVAINTGYTLGDWEKAIAIADRARKIAQETDSFSYYIAAGQSLINDTPQQALNTCRELFIPYQATVALIVNACAHRAGNTEWIEKTEKHLSELGLSNIDDRIEIIRRRRYEPKLSRIMIEAWSNIETQAVSNTDTNSSR